MTSFGTKGNVAIGRLDALASSVTVATVVANSTEIDFRRYSGGVVHVPAGSSTTSLTYYAAEQPGGTYLPLYDADGTAVTQTVAAGRAYALPTASFGAAALKLVGDAAGTVTLSLKG